MIQHMEIVHENGQPILLEAWHPLAFISHCFQTCDGWYALLQKRLQLKHATEDDPWSLILYTDEVTPGNALATQTSRKVYAIYYSFKEMGAAAPACEDAWFGLATVRSSVVDTLLSASQCPILLRCSRSPWTRGGDGAATGTLRGRA